MATFKKTTIELDEAVVKKLRRFFDTKTDKDAVNRALRLIADESDIIETHTALAGKLELDGPFS